MSQKLSKYERFLKEFKNKQPRMYKAFRNSMKPSVHEPNHVIIHTRFGDCVMLKDRLLDGKQPNILDAKDMTKYFVNMANVAHRYKYRYDNTQVMEYFNPILVTCPKHGDFKILPSKHLHGHGCPQCKILKK